MFSYKSPEHSHFSGPAAAVLPHISAGGGRMLQIKGLLEALVMAWLRPGAASPAAAGPLFQPEEFAEAAGASGAPYALGTLAESWTCHCRSCCSSAARTGSMVSRMPALPPFCVSLGCCCAVAPLLHHRTAKPGAGAWDTPRARKGASRWLAWPFLASAARRSSGAPEGPLASHSKTRPKKRSEYMQLGNVRKRRLLKLLLQQSYWWQGLGF